MIYLFFVYVLYEHKLLLKLWAIMSRIPNMKMTNASLGHSSHAENSPFLDASSKSRLHDESANKHFSSHPKLSRQSAIQTMFEKVVAVEQYHRFWMTANALLSIIHHIFYLIWEEALFTIKELNKAIGWNPQYKHYLNIGNSYNPKGVFWKQWQPKVLPKGKKWQSIESIMLWIKVKSHMKEVQKEN